MSRFWVGTLVMLSVTVAGLADEAEDKAEKFASQLAR